jgi:hypothetical protein
MNRIEEIRSTHEWIKQKSTNEPQSDESAQYWAEKYTSDIGCLLAKLEIATKALQAAKEQFDLDDHQHFDGGTWSKYIESTEGYRKVVEALKAIRE